MEIVLVKLNLGYVDLAAYLVLLQGTALEGDCWGLQGLDYECQISFLVDKYIVLLEKEVGFDESYPGFSQLVVYFLKWVWCLL